jgi:hypothetical protein
MAPALFFLFSDLGRCLLDWVLSFFLLAKGVAEYLGFFIPFLLKKVRTKFVVVVACMFYKSRAGLSDQTQVERESGLGDLYVRPHSCDTTATPVECHRNQSCIFFCIEMKSRPCG